MEYKIPEPKDDPKAALVTYFKVLKGVEYDDRVWDKVHFGRGLKSAKELLAICKDFEQAKRCIDELSKKFEELDVTWSFETIVKHAYDWRQRRGKKNDTESRKRFFDALTKQRTDGKDLGKGKGVTGRQILGPLGNFEILSNGNGHEERPGSEADGGSDWGFQPDDMEAKEA